jgi:hypothetical protein
LNAPYRARSEAKEVFKNQRLLDLINAKKSSVSPTIEKQDSLLIKDMFRKSIEESENETDSGIIEIETDSEKNFPELRKLSRYQRASTHSRLYKLLQGDDEEGEVEEVIKEVPRRPPKIIHNVSVTRRNNPNAFKRAGQSTESPSPASSPSPTPVNDKLVNELVQSLLLQNRVKRLNLPVDKLQEKLHNACYKILQEDMESNGTFSSGEVESIDSTPALTPQDFRSQSSYSDYYDSFSNNTQTEDEAEPSILPSKAFKNLQDQQSGANKKLWSVRCPRILSSKSVNKDLTRLSEVRESVSPDHGPNSNSNRSRSAAK